MFLFCFFLNFLNNNFNENEYKYDYNLKKTHPILLVIRGFVAVN